MLRDGNPLVVRRSNDVMGKQCHPPLLCCCGRTKSALRLQPPEETMREVAERAVHLFPIRPHTHTLYIYRLNPLLRLSSTHLWARLGNCLGQLDANKRDSWIYRLDANGWELCGGFCCGICLFFAPSIDDARSSGCGEWVWWVFVGQINNVSCSRSGNKN